MKVAACQLPDVRNDVSRALALVETYTLDAQERGAELVCFPECFLQGYDVDARHVAEVAIDLASPAFAQLAERLQAFAPVIVLGLIERESGRFFNSAVAIERGQLIARYRKVRPTSPLH
jgi:predicted amidohydrolase